MADKTMHHVVIGSDTYEIVDETARVGAGAAFATDTASGSVASFSDGADNVPVKSLSVGIEAVQSGSGDPSPTNIRPISGWDAVKVARCGKNLIALEALSLPTSGHDIKDNNGKIINSSSSAYTHGYIGVKPATTYTLLGKFTATSNAMYVYEYDAGRNWIGRRSLGSWPTAESQNIFTTGSNTYYIQIQYINASSGADPTTWGLYEGETVADDTEQGQTYTIPLGQTVYGGSLDVSTGELTVTHGTVDMGTLNWSRYTSSTNPLFRVGVPRQYSSEHPNVYGLCSFYAWYGNATLSAMGTSMPDKQFGFQSTSNYVCVRDDTYTDAASFKAAVSGQMMFYPLAEPQILTLTAEQVTTLLGTNNIYADAGSVSVNYRADTGLYIDKRLNA